MNRRSHLPGTITALFFAIVVANCGGGGGGFVPPAPTTQPPPPPPPPPPPEPEPEPEPEPDPGPTADDFRTIEYNRNWGLDAINSADAYAAGFTGAGVTVGFLDFNFDFSSPEIDFHPSSEGVDAASVAIYEAQIGEPAPTDEHGHATAVVAAGVKNDVGTHGVAFDSQVLAVDFFSNVNETQVMQGGDLFHVSDPWTYMTDRGALIVNKSLGFDEDDIIQDPPDVDEFYVLESDANVVINGGLLVSSAGNNSDPEPSLSNLQTIDELLDAGLLDSGPGAFIIVGAVNSSNQIASFSDRAGQARNHYLVAPGVNIRILWNGVLTTGSGTSFSAPHVTGAAAILFERWPTLSPREVADILFATAIDLGAPGIDAIYGHGLVNLDAAIQPVGTSTLAVQGTDVGPLLSGSAVTLGSAFGDAPAFRTGLSDIMMLDGFRRDFQVDLSSLVLAAPRPSRLSAILADSHTWRSTALNFDDGSRLAVSVAEDSIETASLAFLGRAAEDLGPDRDMILEFSSDIGGIHFTAGNGRRMGDAVGVGSGVGASITEAWRSAVDTGSGAYAIAGFDVGERMRLSVGLSTEMERGVERHPVPALQRDRARHAAAVRFDRYGRTSRFGIEAGTLIDTGGPLGSRSSGGLGMSDNAQTSWLTLQGERYLGAGLGIIGSITAARTTTADLEGNLFHAPGYIDSTGFAIGALARNVIQPDDALSFTVHQPLRVESASMTVVTGISRDPGSGGVIFGERDLSLVPSGREIALETAYRTTIGNWSAVANFGWRFDAGHVSGAEEAAFVVAFQRDF